MNLKSITGTGIKIICGNLVERGKRANGKRE